MKTSHGGSTANGKRKSRRPLDCKKPLHLVLKSSKAVGQYNLLRTPHRTKVKALLYKQAQKFGVRIHSYANVGNHLHICLRFSSRKAFQNFLRSAAATIARVVTKARKGKVFGKFWDGLAFSRVISSRREVHILKKYLVANQIEAKLGALARELFLEKRADWEERIFLTSKFSQL